MVKCGKMIANLRKVKKLTISELTGNRIHRSTYERFVKGDTKLSVNNLIYMLNQLHVNFDEFMRFSNDDAYRDIIDYRHFVERFEQAILLEDTVKLHHLGQEVATYRQHIADDDHLYYHLLILIDANYAMLCHQSFNKNHVAIVNDYLLRCEAWTSYELFLFDNIFFTMKGDVVKALLLRILRHLDDPEATLASQRERVHIILRIITVCILHKKLSIAQTLLIQLNNTLNIWSDAYHLLAEELCLDFLNDIIEMINGHAEYADAVLNTMNTLKHLDNKLYESACQRYLDQVLTIYHLPATCSI